MSVLESEFKISSTADSSVILIEPSHGWRAFNLKEIWAYRELLYFLIWRDVKVKYKQTVIGAAWAIVQPFMTMIVFTLVFKKIADISSDGIPYPIFAYAALLPWNLFAGALDRSTKSLVAQSHLISKVYFPRLIIPLSSTFSGLVDFVIAFVILVGMMVWYHIIPTLAVLYLPLFIILALGASLSVGLWLSALNVRYRDIGHTIPFLIQIWLFASPVAYPVSLVPEKWRLLYSLNPLAGVIEGFRWVLLGRGHPDFTLIMISAIMVAALLFGGIAYFKRMEKTFADVV